MVKETFDLIVVGAGPAGLAAAYVAAKAGLKVIIFERGEYPGSKNMFGGVLYGHSLAELIPEFYEEAPIERALIEERYWLLSGDAATTFSFRTKNFGQPPYNGFSVLRAKFDRWFADKVVAEGALLVTETLVEKLIMKNDRCIGVQTGRREGDVYADAVIVAEGVNSLLTRDIGIHKEWRGDEVGVGAKELIALPRETIEDRFNLEENEGVAMRIIGLTKGMMGGAFIYTNLESISLGVVCMVEEVKNSGACPNDLIEDMKNHSLIRPLIEGGETKEYSAHMVPEAGYKSVPQLTHDGLLIAGDAAAISNLLTGEGANLAITTGRLAAEAVIKAKENGDFSRQGLSYYDTKLRESYVMRDLRQFKDFAEFMHHTKTIHGLYPEMLADVLKDMLRVDGVPKDVKMKEAKKLIKQKRSYINILKDVWRGWRSVK